MQTIQLVLSDASYARKLKQLLCDNGNWPVTIRDNPSFQKGGVVVLDEKVLAGLASSPDYPDRVVLVTHNDPEILSHAWDLGIRSVVYNTDTPGTVLLAIMSAGAYGMVMSSNYNTRPRAAEVLVRGADAALVRRRESIDSLLALEEPLA